MNISGLVRSLNECWGVIDAMREEIMRLRKREDDLMAQLQAHQEHHKEERPF